MCRQEDVIFSMSLMYSFIGNNFKHYFHHYSSSEGGNLIFFNACAITISTDYTLLDCKSLIHVNLISLLFVNVIHVRHQRFPLNGVKKYSTGCCRSTAKSTACTVGTFLFFVQESILVGTVCRCHGSVCGQPSRPGQGAHADGRQKAAGGKTT